MEPLHSTGLTRTFRIVSRVILIVDLISSILCLVGFAAAGTTCLCLRLLPEIAAEEAADISMLSCGITFLALIPLFIALIIYSAICLKQVKKPTHEQFLGVAIASFIFSEPAVGVFSLIIYINESRMAKIDSIQ